MIKKQHSKNCNSTIENQKKKSICQNIFIPKMKELQNEYQTIQQQIKSMMSRNAKPIQIRVKQWLRKLQSVAEVQLWLRNRNLYLKVLSIMLKKQELSYPFNKLPPNSSLPMLSLYEVSFDVRKQLEEQYVNDQNFSNNEGQDQKENINGLSNKINTENGMSCHRSRQKYNNQSKIANKQIQQFAHLQEPKIIDKQITQTLRLSYDFILKNMSHFSDKEEADSLLEQLWNFSTFR